MKTYWRDTIYLAASASLTGDDRNPQRRESQSSKIKTSMFCHLYQRQIVFWNNLKVVYHDHYEFNDLFTVSKFDCFSIQYSIP